MMKSCEFCNLNNNGFCSFREEQLTKESANTCDGYRDKKSIALTTRQYDMLFDTVTTEIVNIEELLRNSNINEKQEKGLKAKLKELDELASIIGSLTL